jgi:AraC-like DNA-binding protein/mannose-6-phosphate isomerase-like protein (cupin superfamily)
MRAQGGNLAYVRCQGLGFGWIISSGEYRFSRNQVYTYRKKGIMAKPFSELLVEIDETTWVVNSSATDYPENWVIEPHRHTKHQLIYAIQGVMVVQCALGQWTVPPSRGIWMPCGHTHSIRCVGRVKMRSIFVQPTNAFELPLETKAVSISPLLSELIKASMDIKAPRDLSARDGRILNLILDEICVLPTLPLHLPQPLDHRINLICSALQRKPSDGSTLADWSEHLDLDTKTIQRLFRKETGMTFGQWRTQARLLLAMERIAIGEKIIDIALELGYDSPSAFTTMFKKQFGKTPSNFFQ